MTDSSYPSPAHFRKPLLETPFHERARDLAQTDHFVPWSGYTTVDVFSTVEQEYFAIRNAATLYDLTPMVKYRVTGMDAERYLNRLVTRDVRKLRAGSFSDADGAMVKAWVPEMEGRVLDACVQLWGGSSFVEDNPISRMYTAARLQPIHVGPNELHKSLLGRNYLRGA